MHALSCLCLPVTAFFVRLEQTHSAFKKKIRKQKNKTTFHNGQLTKSPPNHPSCNPDRYTHAASCVGAFFSSTAKEPGRSSHFSVRRRNTASFQEDRGPQRQSCWRREQARIKQGNPKNRTTSRRCCIRSQTNAKLVYKPCTRPVPSAHAPKGARWPKGKRANRATVSLFACFFYRYACRSVGTSREIIPDKVSNRTVIERHAASRQRSRERGDDDPIGGHLQETDLKDVSSLGTVTVSWLRPSSELVS